MAETYKTRYGWDWPPNMHDVFIDLSVAKKHRQMNKAYGAVFPDPHVRLLDACRALLPRSAFTISPWTEEHAYDFTNYTKNVTWGCASSSKAQPLDAIVITPGGPRPMGDITVGDLVCVPDGGAAVVVKTQDVGVVDEYVVSFSGRVSTRCAGDHLWEVRAQRSGVTRTLSTLALAALTQKQDYSIGLPDPVQFDPVNLDMDPYLLGALLGDGYFGGATGRHNLRFCSADADILAHVRKAIGPGYHLEPLRNRPYDFRVARNTRGRYPSHRYKAALRKYGLWGLCGNHKFIPREYKYASIAQRLSLLQGLMDTDGSCSRIGCAKFTSTSLQLVQDVADVVHSLGGKAVFRKPYSPKLPGKPNESALMMYTLGVTLPDMSLVFRCARKRARTLAGKTKGRLTRRTLVSVCKTGRQVPMKCITIDHPRHVYLTDSYILTKNSNDYGLFTDLYWIVDPFETVCLVGSTTLGTLKSRTWESIVRYHSYLKLNPLGVDIPGVFSRNGYAILNVADLDIPESQGAKASIQGRALNDGGTLQGAHLPYVLLLVDELATVANQENIKTAMVNLRSGAVDFRVFFLANPETWADPSCQYCEPPDGPASVDVDTGEWHSSMGFHVRHHDGLKSPRITMPEKYDEYRYLLGPEDVAESMTEANDNEDAPSIWKMIRGFPLTANSVIQTVLDYSTAKARKCCDPMQFTGMDYLFSTVVGVDPAWSSGGDAAIWYPLDVYSSAGTPLLVFREPEQLPIKASEGTSALEQLSSQVYDKLLHDRDLDATLIGYDASGNQSLGGAVAMRTGISGLDVNNSKRASDYKISPTRKKANEEVYDRGSEAWSVLAEFIRAGQVRGLGHAACRQLCTRRWATRKKGSMSLMLPLRMEAKETWAPRESRGSGSAKSPNECDAAALAALVVKERLGITPWVGAVPDIIPSGAVPGRPWDGTLPDPDPAPSEGYTTEASVGGYSEPP